MKQYTDQGKVDTRSGFGAGLIGLGRTTKSFGLVVFVFLWVSSCIKTNYDDEPNDYTPVFGYGHECIVNGELMGHQVWLDYLRFDYRTGWYPISPPFAFDGLTREEDDSLVVDYSSLAFSLQLLATPIKESDSFCYLFFYIKGEDKGPFIPGKDYSSSFNVATCYPGNYYGRSLGGYWDYVYSLGYPPDLQGLKVKMLSSSFKFGYSQIDIDDLGTVDVLDFYYDFEEVITQTPDGYSLPAIGDTIKVSNGHFQQVISLYNKELTSVFHRFIDLE